MSDNDKCYIGAEDNSQKIANIIYTISRGLIINYLAVFIILRIFQLNDDR
jgi:hypothetical protein